MLGILGYIEDVIGFNGLPLALDVCIDGTISESLIEGYSVGMVYLGEDSPDRAGCIDDVQMP